MTKSSKRIPPALKHGIYSGLGLLPTESAAKFRRFKKQVFAELNPVGRLEKGFVEQIVVLEWRRQNLSTYDLAQRARALRNSIHSKCVPSQLWDMPLLELPLHPESPSPEAIEAGRKRADKQIGIELGAAIELVELGDVATLDHLEKRLAILDRLNAMIAHHCKELAYVRAFKSVPPRSLPALSPPLLENTTT